MSDEGPVQHVLFSPEDGKAPPLIDGITVSRQGPTGPVVHPHYFRPSELESLEQIFTFWGGGTYTLQGKLRGKVQATRRFTLEGIPRPLRDMSEAPPAPAAPAAPAINPEAGMMPLILQMMQQSQQVMMTIMVESSKQSANMMLAMLNRSDSQQAAMITAITETSRQNQASQAEYFKHLAEVTQKTATAQGGNIDTFKQGMELGNSIAELALARQQPESDSLGESISAILGGIGQQMMAAKGAASNAPPLPPLQ